MTIKDPITPHVLLHYRIKLSPFQNEPNFCINQTDKSQNISTRLVKTMYRLKLSTNNNNIKFQMAPKVVTN